MTKLILSFFLIFVLIFNSLYSQYSLHWQAGRPDYPVYDFLPYPKLAVDGAGNSFVSYQYLNFVNWDYLTVKYDSSGVQQWARTYDRSPGYGEWVIGNAVDKFGNVAITGYSVSLDHEKEMVTIKYSGGGDSLWVRIVNDAEPAKIVIDDSGNVFVSATVNAAGKLLKYSSGGELRWSIDIGAAATKYLVAGKYGDIYLSRGNLISKFDRDGNYLWDFEGVYDVSALSRDSFDNIYTCGGNFGFKVSSEGVKELGFYEDFHELTNIFRDGSGNIYVTGRNIIDFAVMKFDGSGNFQWRKTYSEPMDSLSYSPDYTALDDNGNLFVTHSLRTRVYNPSGELAWIGGYDAGRPASIYVAPAGDKVYVGGFINYNSLRLLRYDALNSVKLNLKMAVEGLYRPELNELSRLDEVSVYLRDVNSPYATVDSARAGIDVQSFRGLFNFNNSQTGDYYIEVKHFNSIETWSSAGRFFFNTDTVNYDFTNSSSQAYGNNLRLKGTKYCIFSGDVNQDGMVDLSDGVQIFNKSITFSYGNYLPEDLNGDLLVDLSDLILCYINAKKFIGVIRP